MFKSIKVGKHEIDFLANGATPYIYKDVFHEDLYNGMNVNGEKTKSKDQEEADRAGINLVDIGTKLAYVLNSQAEKRSVSKLGKDDFYKWLEKFEATDLSDDETLAEIFNVLNSDMATTSEVKN